jgi:predicted transcriptional regulator YheO
MNRNLIETIHQANLARLSELSDHPMVNDPQFQKAVERLARQAYTLTTAEFSVEVLWLHTWSGDRSFIAELLDKGIFDAFTPLEDAVLLV